MNDANATRAAARPEPCTSLPAQMGLDMPAMAQPEELAFMLASLYNEALNALCQMLRQALEVRHG